MKFFDYLIGRNLDECDYPCPIRAGNHFEQLFEQHKQCQSAVLLLLILLFNELYKILLVSYI